MRLTAHARFLGEGVAATLTPLPDRGAIGKVPIEVTRWWPTLLHAPLCVQERPMYPVGDRPTGAKPRAP